MFDDTESAIAFVFLFFAAVDGEIHRAEVHDARLALIAELLLTPEYAEASLHDASQYFDGIRTKQERQDAIYQVSGFLAKRLSRKKLSSIFAHCEKITLADGSILPTEKEALEVLRNVWRLT